MPFNTGPGLNPFDRAIFAGEGYRLSRRATLDDGQELIVHIDPTVAGGTVVLETPRINPEERADYDVFENADPGSSATGDLFVHNMDYDSQETPDATVTDVASGGLDTTNADQTEQTLIDENSSELVAGPSGQRQVYRVIPPSDTISIVITDRSGGTTNDYAIDGVLYEGDVLPG